MTARFKIYDISSKYLNKVSSPITFPISEEVLKNIEHLKIAFKASLARQITLGLSAPQVGINKRLFIIPKSFNYTAYNSPSVCQAMVRNYQVFINPKILQQSNQKQIREERCLSVPDHYLVQRSKTIKLQYFKPDGQIQIKDFSGVMAKIIQHETDHLDGITIDQIGTRPPPPPSEEEKQKK